jgi:integrase
MARPIAGSVIEHRGKDGRTYRSLRFTAYKKRRHVKLGPVSADEAARQLSYVIADVERGTWQPPEAIVPPPEPERVPTFIVFADQWWKLNEKRLAPNTQADYLWRLETHLIPYFGELPISTIAFGTIESYIAAKQAEDDPLSARSINMTITLLGAILERAVKHKLIDQNAARDRDLRVKERAPARSYLDAATQIEALLNAAGELDREATPERQHIHRRAMIATLTLAGLRIGELCSLRWRDVDLASGWLHVGEAKTDAGRRRVKIRGALRDELLNISDSQSPEAFVFGTSAGGRQSPNNFRSRVLRAAVKRADERLVSRGLPPLPDRITPHSLRRTFCSLLYALGEDPGVVMDEMGHTDPGLALRVYRQAMRRDESEKAALLALVEGGVLADSGRRAINRPPAKVEREAA